MPRRTLFDFRARQNKKGVCGEINKFVSFHFLAGSPFVQTSTQSNEERENVSSLFCLLLFSFGGLFSFRLFAFCFKNSLRLRAAHTKRPIQTNGNHTMVRHLHICHRTLVQ